MNDTLDVEIYGQKYSLKAVENQEKLVSVASKIDRKMKELAKKLALTSTSKLAILAALNIVYENEIEQSQNFSNYIESELDDLISELDSVDNEDQDIELSS